MNEQLSAFLDNEATRDESDSVVSALLRDKSLRDSWTRQHWIRTTLRAHSAETPVAVDTDFADRVMQAIADEDHLESAAPARDNVVPMRRTGRTRRWRGVAGFAAAASVAGVVLLAGNPFVRGGSSTDTRIASVGGSSQATTRTREAAPESASQRDDGFGSGSWDNRLADFSSISAQPAGVQTVAAGSASASGMRTNAASTTRRARMSADGADQWSVSDPAVRDELNGYLVDHNGMARSYGMSGTTPGLIRVATYGQDVAQ